MTAKKKSARNTGNDPIPTQRLELCAREHCNKVADESDRLCKRHRAAFEESKGRGKIA